METRGTVPGSALAPEELVGLTGHPGPYATAYLCTESAVDNAAQRAEQRWKPLRQDLIEQGAPEDMVGAIDPLVADAHLRGEGLAVVVPAEGDAFFEHLPDPPRQDLVRWGPLPALGPLLESRQRRVPYVLARVDRQGADLVAVHRQGPEVAVDRVEVQGEDHPIHRAKPGGWSQRRYQERVEDTWEENAEQVAAALVRLVERIDARLVLVAGDVRALQLLQDSLPEPVRAMVRTVDGSRATDGSEEITESEAARLLATANAEDTRQLLEKLKEERGQHDRAADGLQETAAAVSEARASVVLVPEEVEGATLWFGPEPVPVATSAQGLTDLGGSDPQEGPAPDVLIRAALGTGAGVRIVPAHAIPGKVGAILRW
jgi:hypothetical protein